MFFSRPLLIKINNLISNSNHVLESYEFHAILAIEWARASLSLRPDSIII